MRVSPADRVPHLRRGFIAPKVGRAASVGVQRRKILAGTLITLVAAAMLFFFPPQQYAFYPQCPIHQIFGILCPGCGTTRALAALLHGHLAEALRLNALTVLGLPAWMAWLLFRRRPLQPSPAILYAAFAGTVFFTIGRNL